MKKGDVRVKKGKGQRGFTLIELLVVVGIIAALAAILVPNVARFVGTGREQGAAAELDSVQAALDAAIAENGWTSVTAGSDVTDFSSVGTWSPGNDAAGNPVYLYPEYLRFPNAKYGDGLNRDGTPGDGLLGYDISDTGEVTP